MYKYTISCCHSTCVLIHDVIKVGKTSDIYFVNKVK